MKVNEGRYLHNSLSNVTQREQKEKEKKKENLSKRLSENEIILSLKNFYSST